MLVSRVARITGVNPGARLWNFFSSVIYLYCIGEFLLICSFAYHSILHYCIHVVSALAMGEVF
jgi:hypothetical protein